MDTKRGDHRSEKEKMQAGELYDANYDTQLLAERTACGEKLYDFNRLRPSQTEERDAALRTILGSAGSNTTVISPFFCDYGCNIQLGNNVFINTGCVILDEANVSIGDNAFIAPNCAIYTAGHPLDIPRRNQGLEYAKPVTIGRDVWIGGNVCILPGVTIGDGAVIGAGSVVIRDIPANTLAVGNPCRPVRQIK